MPKLSVEKFSCIKEATIELAPVTVLIGAQASGKSVISKLIHFFSSYMISQINVASEGNTVSHFRQRIGDDFSKAFPPSAWGDADFVIKFNAGKFGITISRSPNKSQREKRVKVELSAYVTKRYNELSQAFRKLPSRAGDDEYWRYDDRGAPIRREFMKLIRSDLGAELINFQIFVPAGRSFFTNLGKAFAMLEHGGHLDDFTKDFGRLFTVLIDQRLSPMMLRDQKEDRAFFDSIKSGSEEIFGGKLNLSTNDMHLSTKDGRKIPLSYLSSGQQELIPLVLALEYFTAIISGRHTSGLNVLYIEEPEAHLFPTSQAFLTDQIVRISNYGADNSALLITTHSPYVLSELNNLLKANKVGRRSKSDKVRVGKVVAEDHWLSADAVRAYALVDGVVKNIVDDSGLINADYLDDVSSQISNEFNRLLEIEYARDSR